MSEQHWYTVSDDTYKRIQDRVTAGFVLAPVAQFIDGRVRFPVEQDTHERLEEHRLPGETDDQLIYRVTGGMAS